MKFNLMIDSQNAAMCGGGRAEVARLLHKVADEVEAGGEYGQLLDSNGNGCGEWECDDERPDFFCMEAADLFEQADDMAVNLDQDPRQLSREELIEGLESIGVACYDDEETLLLAEAYGDSMMAGDLGHIDRLTWPDALEEAWNQ